MSELHVSPISDTEWVLTSDFSFRFHLWNRDFVGVLPKGATSDGASIPRWCWSITGLLPTGLYLGAAFVHDHAYAVRGNLPNSRMKLYRDLGSGILTEVSRQFWLREDADEVFRQLVAQVEPSKWKVAVMYRAVRLFGEAAWRRSR